jgi:glycine betaine/proline transport system substrate-binding protein
MTHRKAYWIGAVIIATLVVMGLAGTAQAAGKTVTIGFTSWSDAEFMSQLVKQQIENNTSVKVELKKVDIADQYKAVADGKMDAMIDGWFPDTHASYWKKVHNKVVDLGPMYNGAVVGWAVPKTVSKALADSISDLKKKGRADKFDHTIVGIDPDAGEMKESAKALKAYDLKDSYDLKEGSGKSMTDALANAAENLDPIVVTLWTPHWAFAKWDLRFLKDPKHIFGGPQHVDAVVRKGFRKDHPKVAKFLTSLYIPLQKLQKAMYKAHKTDEKTAVSKFVKNHQGLVAAWWAGTGAKASDLSADASISGGS